MFLGESSANSTEEKCSLFADHFSSVFNSNTTSDQQVEAALLNVPEHIVSMGTLQFSTNEVLDALCGMKSSSNPGPDGIPSLLLKKCAGVLCRPLCSLINLSLRNRKFPECWKRSYMFPVFKKGDKRDIANYRGITSLCPKLFEILMGKMLFRKMNSYISTAQHGFYSGCSTSTNLLEFTSFCITGMDE